MLSDSHEYERLERAKSGSIVDKRVPLDADAQYASQQGKKPRDSCASIASYAACDSVGSGPISDSRCQCQACPQS